MDDTATAIRDFAADQAAALDLELVDVELKGEGARRLVRLVVDRKGGVGVDVCQQLSRAIGDRLDALDPIGGRYTLEVTSPGVDRPLTDRASFDRVEGREVVIDRRTSDENAREVRGRVVRAGPDAVDIEQSGTTVSVAYREIVTATQALPW